MRASWTLDGVGVQALLESAPTLTAIELRRPGGGRASRTRVVLDGDDVFGTPAEELFRRAAGRGWRAGGSRPEHLVIPGVSLGFTRQTSQGIPRDAEGLPVYVASVLVCGKDHYDFRRAGRC